MPEASNEPVLTNGDTAPDDEKPVGKVGEEYKNNDINVKED